MPPFEAEKAELRRPPVNSPAPDGPAALSQEDEAHRSGQRLRAANAALRQSEERCRLIVESATKYAIFTLDNEGRVTSWNTGAERILGWTEAEILGRPAAILYTTAGIAADLLGTEMWVALTEGRFETDEWMLRRGGRRFWAAQTLMLLRDESGGSHGFLKILRDRTAYRAAEDSVRDSEARFRHMADSAPALIWMTDQDGSFTFTNRHFEHLFGRPSADFLGDGWFRVILPEDAGRVRQALMSALHAREPFRAELRVRDRDGQVRWLRCEGVPRSDDGGRFLGFTGCDVDITEARLAAAELERRVAARTAELSHALGQLHAEVLEREQAEEALRQAQKMEAVGQLTGGIAHDFNNMLQAIGGSLELTQRRIKQSRAAEAAQFLDSARQTVERAAGLTNRLLAFARRQALQPRHMDADELIKGMTELIRRTVGPAISVELRLGDGVWMVRCDPNQLENAVLNLAINARDAMPGGGCLTLSTADVRLSEADVAGQEGAAPGDYVEIAVADTGTGMDEVTRARAFEPFFTTKPLGQGTGLGLSQLYGFVRQSGGVVGITSAPGRGTTVRLVLPRHDQMQAREEHPAPDKEPEPAEAGETVLVVEDEEKVRAVAAAHFKELGYAVLEAADGPEALLLLRSGARVDVLVTDVGLPGGMNGRQLADGAREHKPGLPVVFITGYAGSALENRLAPGMLVVGKPFTLEALTSAVQTLVNAAPAQPQ